MKRQKPLKRRTGLTSRKKLNRKTAVKRKNARRSAKEFRRAYGSKERVQAVQAMPCVVCGALPSQNAHVRSRGAGGGAEDIVPLCGGPGGCHTEQHTIGVQSFERKHGICLKDAARKTQEAWDALRGCAGEDHQQG